MSRTLDLLSAPKPATLYVARLNDDIRTVAEERRAELFFRTLGSLALVGDVPPALRGFVTDLRENCETRTACKVRFDTLTTWLARLPGYRRGWKWQPVTFTTE